MTGDEWAKHQGYTKAELALARHFAFRSGDYESADELIEFEAEPEDEGPQFMPAFEAYISEARDTIAALTAAGIISPSNAPTEVNE